MKIALVGTGRMGQAVEALAVERGHVVTARFNTSRRLEEADGVEALDGADVVIDFSSPDVGVAHIETYCRWRQPAVIGTTGWYEALPQVKAWVEEHRAALLYAPNFSLGVALLVRAVHALTPLLEQLPEYDVGLQEAHHTHKVDSPSGTALMLAGLLVDGLTRKTHVEVETQHQRIAPEAFHVTSMRLGGVVGIHTLHLDSPYDHIRLTHEAKNRQGFAFGAVRAAEWLPGRTGFFTLEDVLADWLSV